MRAQAELVSTVIIVSIAVVIGLALVYYLTPLLAENRANQQLASYLAEVSSGLDAGIVYSNETDSGYLAVFSVYAARIADSVHVYLAVVAEYANLTGRLLAYPEYDYQFSLLTANATLVNASTGWINPTRLLAEADTVYAGPYDGQLYPYSSLSDATVIPLYDGGVLQPLEEKIYRVIVYGPTSGIVYKILVLVEVSGRYYPVAVLVP
ncbi:MAG TPA: hypothetical protein EYP33_04990 [Pyrodictium sp.]|nr:hypothetical protein [Pyrodictium sp.]